MIGFIFKYIYHFLIGLILFFLCYFIWKIGFGIPSSHTDLSYHLATAQGFLRAGGVTTWDFWESLPIGRPHNYPPLFHVVLASYLKIGISPVTAVKLMMEITIIGGLFVYAWGISRLFSIKVAFWGIVMLASSFHFVQLSATVMPATIVIFLSPALLYFAIKQKWIAYSALLTLMFYLHLFMPYFILLSLLVYLSLFRKKLFLTFLSFSTVAFVLYIPWFTHILFGGFEYIKYFDPSTASDLWKEHVIINITVIIFAVAGLILLFKKRKDLQSEYFFFLIASLIILCPSFLIASRLIDSHFLVFISVFFGLFFSVFFQNKWKYLAVFIFLFYFWYTPILKLFHEFGFYLQAGTANNFIRLSGDSDKNYDPPANFSTLFSAIKIKAKAGDTITTLLTSLDGKPIEKNYRLTISNIFASFTNLSTLNLRQPEIYHRALPDITKTKYLLTNTSINELNADYFANLGYKDTQNIAVFVKDNFQPISYASSEDQVTIYCYINKSSDAIKEAVPNFKFPLLLGDGILLIFIGIILYDNKTTKGKNDKKQ